MTKRGHTVYHYGHPDSEVPCSKHFDVVSIATHEKDYKKEDWRNFLSQKVSNKTHEEFNLSAAKIINEIGGDEDFVLAFWGHGNSGTCSNLKNKKIKIVEPSIGYDSCFAPFRVFESYAQLHKMVSLQEGRRPSWTDHVIAPGFEERDFLFSEKKEDYLLFLGRMTNEKGVCEAQAVAKAVKTKIKFVGPQNMKNDLDKKCPYSEFLHTAGEEERKNLLSKAKALIMPSLYMEPCGWTMLESFFSGTPVISTDWGGMSEYNLHGRTGFRCHSFNEFYHAVKRLGEIDNFYCRKYAENNFSVEKMCKNYENYFSILSSGFNTVFSSCEFAVPKKII